jgi:hypothetical protein
VERLDREDVVRAARVERDVHDVDLGGSGARSVARTDCLFTVAGARRKPQGARRHTIFRIGCFLSRRIRAPPIPPVDTTYRRSRTLLKSARLTWGEAAH